MSALARQLHAEGAPPPQHRQDEASGRYARGFLRTLQAAGLDEQAIAEELVSLVALWLDERVMLEAEADAVCDATTALHVVQSTLRARHGLDPRATDGPVPEGLMRTLPAVETVIRPAKLERLVRGEEVSSG